MSKILVTGGTGFLAAHVVDLLLKRGYDVITTVRSKDKADFLIRKYPQTTKLHTVFVKDIQQTNAFDHVFQNDKNINVVIHTASPFTFKSDDPVNSLLNPAIKGTENILYSIKKYAPQVKKVVVTSSFISIVNVDRLRDPKFVHTEDTWNPITWKEAAEEPGKGYMGSKTLAEKALWDFVAREKPNFSATTINPPYVFGPIINQIKSPDQINTSNETIYRYMTSSPDDGGKKYNKVINQWVDVRDAALAHILAFEKPDSITAGKRWLPLAGLYTPQTILDVLNTIPELKGKIPVGYPGTGLAEEHKFAKVDNSKTDKEFGLAYRSFDQCIVDTAHSLLAIQKSKL